MSNPRVCLVDVNLSRKEYKQIRGWIFEKETPDVLKCAKKSCIQNLFVRAISILENLFLMMKSKYQFAAVVIKVKKYNRSKQLRTIQLGKKILRYRLKTMQMLCERCRVGCDSSRLIFYLFHVVSSPQIFASQGSYMIC